MAKRNSFQTQNYCTLSQKSNFPQIRISSFNFAKQTCRYHVWEINDTEWCSNQPSMQHEIKQIYSTRCKESQASDRDENRKGFSWLLYLGWRKRWEMKWELGGESRRQKEADIFVPSYEFRREKKKRKRKRIRDWNEGGRDNKQKERPRNVEKECRHVTLFRWTPITKCQGWRILQ